jgi:hypothetical protein
MTAAQLQIDETEQERVERWRSEALERAGYEPEAAAELAARQDVDLHRAIGLLESGCPAETALRILL